ncbi:MAG: winged helix-turn-helix transcriptional regulator [Nitrososphaerota archaeon]|nr:winged helix-turn-helix transcriptional regulator [Nitrososphaerota archaeon]MDG7043401.1 winged helix-turn-helix transcriptional regulator [Nitrososphaerota archaeon]
MKYNIVAPLVDNIESIFVAIREFPTEKVYLISNGRQSEKVEEIKSVTDRLGIDVQLLENKEELFQGMFRAFAYLKAITNENSILVNVASGDNMSNCAALSAAFVNGLRAFTVVENRIVFLPVLKFSYYRLLPDRKLAILKFLLSQPDCCSSLEELANRTGMSLPLASYHINGSADTDGLISLGLVETRVEAKGKTKVMLTELGRLMAEGIIEPPEIRKG